MEEKDQKIADLEAKLEQSQKEKELDNAFWKQECDSLQKALAEKDKNDKLAIVLDYMKYQLAFEMLANDYAQKFIEKEDLCMEIGTRQSYWTKEVMENFLSKATDKMVEIVDSVYKGENKC